MEIKGKAALVTGGATGVGRAVALRLAAGGCHVAVNYSRSRDEAEATVAEVRTLGVKGMAIQADVGEDSACRRLVATAAEHLGGLQILVNSAGTTRFIAHENLEEVNPEDWRRILAVNLEGPFYCARAARPWMERAGGGEIVNIASVAGIAAQGSSIPYCASKAGLINLTLALARVMAPKIRVNAVAPGFIEGRWLEQGLGARYEAVRQAYAERNPLGRVSTPDDIAACVLGFITGSDMVTGQSLVCDGGQLIAGNPVNVGSR